MPAEARCRGAKATGKPYKLTDGNGLVLQFYVSEIQDMLAGPISVYKDWLELGGSTDNMPATLEGWFALSDKIQRAVELAIGSTDFGCA